jgi:ABC-2 type transport system ATP-binding protein
MNDAAIEVKGLGRAFEKRSRFLRRLERHIVALEDVSFTVARGELFAMLGPNGAGKTTLSRILATLLLPTAGSARVLGHDVAAEARAIRPRVNLVMGGDRGFYRRLTGRDNLRLFADLYFVPPLEVATRVEELLAMVGLTRSAGEPVETYSDGMKQRLHFARALVNDPDVLFLDEPTVGLDPAGARAVRELIAALRARGKTILMTSHYLFEVDALADRVGVLRDGRLIAVDTPAGVKRRVGGGQVVELECRELPSAAVERIAARSDVSGLSVTAGRGVQQLRFIAPAAAVPVILRGLDHVVRVTTSELTLEEAYLRMLDEPPSEAKRTA